MNFFQALTKLVQSVFKPSAPTPAPKPATSQQLNLPKTAPLQSVTQAAKAAPITPATSVSSQPKSAPTPQPPAASVSQQPSPQPTAPSQSSSVSAPSSPPPAVTQQSTIAPKAIGATSAPQAVSSMAGGGTSGAITGPTSALPGQNTALGIKGLSPDLGPPQVAASSASMNPIMAPPTLGIEQAVREQIQQRAAQATGANAPQTAQPNRVPPIAEPTPTPPQPGVVPTPVQTQQNTPQGRAGSWGLPETGITENLQQGLRNVFNLGGAKSNQGGSNLSDVLGASTAEGAYKTGTKQFGNTSTQGTFTADKPGLNPATSKNILGNLKGSEAAQAIVSALKEPKKIDDVIAGVASEEVKPIIASMIQTASSTGDTDTVHALIGILNGVQKQINFNNMIQKAVTATSMGFGTPNAPGVTEARMPMVQQAVGAGLEGGVPPAPQSSFGGFQGGAAAQMMAPRLPVAPTQQNKPPQFTG